MPTPSTGGILPSSGTVEDRASTLWVPAIAAPVGLALAVVGSGVNVPAEQLVRTPPLPVEAQPLAQPQIIPQAPSREEEIRKAAKPKVYPRKQARY